MARVRLLLIAIGPVQGLIAAGRRCQDLWSGSQLLSDTAGAIAVALRAHSVETLIFPASNVLTDTGVREGRSVANKIMAQLSDDADAEQIAQAALEAGDAYLSKQFETWVEPLDERVVDHELARQQLLGRAEETGMLESFWVHAEGKTYAAARDAAEAALAARKNTRDWTRFELSPTQGRRAKSTIDGTREAVLESPKAHRKDPIMRKAIAKLAKTLKMRPSEVLSGPDLLKRARQSRLNKGLPRIHSTSHMAATPLLTRLHREPALECSVARYLDTLHRLLGSADVNPEDDAHPFFGELGIRVAEGRATRIIEGQQVARDFIRDPRDSAAIDGSAFFPGRVTDLFKSTREPGNERVVHPSEAEAQEALATCLQAFGIGEQPTPYYAMLLGDGDKMGKCLDDIADAGGTAEDHIAFSEGLEDGFASECGPLIANFGGSLIYAGGDDVLAMLPLHTALAASVALKDLFNRAMGAVKLPAGVTKRPTFSIGLALVHHLTPLDMARDLAKSAEKLAKSGHDEQGSQRNALAIVMDKRSGTRVQVTGQWTPDAGRKSLAERMDAWITALEHGHLPDGVAFELEETCRPFTVKAHDTARNAGPDDIPDATRTAIQGALTGLVERVLGRKRGNDGELLKPELLQALLAQVEEDDPIGSVFQMSHEIQIARLISLARKDAGVSLEEKNA